MPFRLSSQTSEIFVVDRDCQILRFDARQTHAGTAIDYHQKNNRQQLGNILHDTTFV